MGQSQSADDKVPVLNLKGHRKIAIDGSDASSTRIAVYKEPDGIFLSGGYFVITSHDRKVLYKASSRGPVMHMAILLERIVEMTFTWSPSQLVEIASYCRKNGIAPPAHIFVGLESIDPLMHLGPIAANETSDTGDTALHLAVQKASLACARALVSVGADVTFTNEAGDAPIHVAAGLRHPQQGEMIKSVLLPPAGASVDEPNGCGLSALCIAVRHDNTQIFKVLTGAGADTRFRTPAGSEPLHIAARHGSFNCMQLLVAAGIPLMTARRDGLTALHISCQAEGNLAVTRLLISSGAPLDAPGEHGRAPVHIAAVHNAEALRLLLETSETLGSLADGRGDLPLHLAVRARALECIDELCKNPHSLNVHMPNKAGETPLTLAYEDDTCTRKLLGVQVSQLQRENARLSAQMQYERNTADPETRAFRDLVQSRDETAAALSLEQEKNEAARAELSRLSAAVDMAQGTLEDERRTRLAEEEAMARLQCSICLDDPVGIAFIPCGHVCCCTGCAASLTDCPLCRQGIRQHLRIFQS